MILYKLQINYYFNLKLWFRNISVFFFLENQPDCSNKKKLKKNFLLKI
jgi:hypothetical protein